MSQLDLGLFANDDWRVRPNLTFSYGLRYEAQTNIGDHGDFSPRIGIAWGIDGNARKAARDDRCAPGSASSTTASAIR